MLFKDAKHQSKKTIKNSYGDCYVISYFVSSVFFHYFKKKDKIIYYINDISYLILIKKLVLTTKKIKFAELILKKFKPVFLILWKMLLIN